MGSHCRLLWEWEMLNKLCVHCFLFEFMHFSTSIKLNWITLAEQGMMRLSTLFLASVAFFLLICCTI